MWRGGESLRTMERSLAVSLPRIQRFLRQTPPPTGCARVGQTRLAGWLRARHVRGYAQLAARAVVAAHSQRVVLPGQEIAAGIVSEIAASLLALDDRLKDLDAQIAATFDLHPQASIIQSMPGFGPFLGASLLAAAGDLCLPQRRAPRRRCRARARPQRLRPMNRQPAQAPPLQQATTTRVLPLGADQHDASRT